jgi:hypothetical protein
MHSISLYEAVNSGWDGQHIGITALRQLSKGNETFLIALHDIQDAECLFSALLSQSATANRSAIAGTGGQLNRSYPLELAFSPRPDSANLQDATAAFIRSDLQR